MYSQFNSLNLFPVSITEILTNVTIAFLCGVFIGIIYKKTYRGAGYSAAFTNSMIILTMITAIVIMVIGNNLARAFGLVGAMSIIRFRTAVKDTQDIVFIFFGLTVGMAARVGYHKIAIAGSLFIGAIIFFLSKFNITSTKANDYLLQFTFYQNGDGKLPYINVMNKYCKKHSIVNVKTIEDKGMMDLAFYVRFRNKDKNQHFIRELEKTKGVKNISLFFDENEI